MTTLKNKNLIKSYFMNIHTGSVDSYANWKNESIKRRSSRYEEERWYFYEALSDGTLVPVIKDEDGDWIRA